MLYAILDRVVDDYAPVVAEQVDGFRQLLRDMLAVNDTLVNQQQNEEMRQLTLASQAQGEEVKKISAWAQSCSRPRCAWQAFPLCVTARLRLR